MKITFYILFGVALVMVAENQYAAMVGDYESAVHGWLGFGLPFVISILTFGIGYIIRD